MAKGASRARKVAAGPVKPRNRLTATTKLFLGPKPGKKAQDARAAKKRPVGLMKRKEQAEARKLTYAKIKKVLLGLKESRGSTHCPSREN